MSNGEDRKFKPSHLAILIVIAIIVGVWASDCKESGGEKQRPAPACSMDQNGTCHYYQ